MHSAWARRAAPAPSAPARTAAHGGRGLVHALQGAVGNRSAHRLLASRARTQGSRPATPATDPALAPLRGEGRPLPGHVREFFQARFQHDFANVRVHTGARTDASARAVDARAFTVGRDIFFGSGQFAPGTAAGRRLIAHELTHVIQQDREAERGSQDPVVRRAAVASPGSCTFELCFLPLSALMERGVHPAVAYAAAHHAFLRWNGDSVGFTIPIGGAGKADARVVRPEPRDESPRDPVDVQHEQCVRARFRTIPRPTPGQLLGFAPIERVGDLISYGTDVAHGVRHCSSPSCELAHSRISHLLSDDRAGLYDLFDENCETWARNVLRAACLQAPEIRLGGLGNMVVRILNETTLGRLYRAGRHLTGGTRPLPGP